MSPSRTSDTPDFISWTQCNEDRWNNFVSRILKAYRPIEQDLQSKSDRREKEAGARLKGRKVELERKMHLDARVAAECEKAQADYSSRAAQFFESLNEAKALRLKRLAESASFLQR